MNNNLFNTLTWYMINARSSRSDKLRNENVTFTGTG